MSEREGVGTTGEESATVLVAGAQTGGKLALLEVRVGRGAELPLHVHHWEDEIVYVLEGEVIFHVNGERLPGPAGTCALLARGSEHSYSVESDLARLLVVVARAGLEQFYAKECRGGTGPGPGIERLVTIGARYGVEVTGPPPGPAPRDDQIPPKQNPMQ